MKKPNTKTSVQENADSARDFAGWGMADENFPDYLDEEYLRELDEDPVTEIEIQAVHWFKKMSDTEVRDVDWQAFQAWLEEDEAHQAVYEELMELWDHPYFDLALQEKKEKLAGPHRVDLSQGTTVWEKAGIVVRNVIQGEVRRARNLVTLLSYAALAASALFASFTWVTHYTGPVSATHNLFYQTRIGEQRTVTLSDGSIVNLNTDTRMHVAFDEGMRKITLTRGEAYFDVMKDGRPFTVAGGTGLVRVLGTAFEVKVNPTRMVVAVDRGRVSVSPQDDPLQGLEITPRQQLTVTHHRLGRITNNTDIVADWRDGWLEFEDIKLEQVAAELDKYYAGNIVLDGENMSAMHVSGRFHVQDVRKAIRILAKSMQLAVATSDTGDIIFYLPNRFEQQPQGWRSWVQ